MDCNFSGSLNLAPLSVWSANFSDPSSSNATPIALSVLPVPVVSSENPDVFPGSNSSRTISAVKSWPSSASCIWTCLASLSLLTTISLIVKSTLLESSTMRSDSPPSDTLIFSPEENSPITFVK